MSILKIILVPLSLILSLFVWLCAGLLSCSGFVFKLASGLLSLLAIAVMITYSQSCDLELHRAQPDPQIPKFLGQQPCRSAA